MFAEFRKFAMRGNVIDLAVGVIIGGAFGKITDSLVNDVLMPPLGLLTGRLDFSKLYWQIGGGSHYVTLDAARKAGVAVIAYGAFINAVIQFIILAFAVFLMIRFINKLDRPEEVAKAPDTTPCPFCTLPISDKATRCPHCTSQLGAQAAPGVQVSRGG